MSQYGFAVVVGHEVPSQIIQNAKNRSKEFFAKSETFKRKFTSGGYGGSGYNAFATEAVADVNKTPDPLESFYLRQDMSSHSAELKDFFDAWFTYRQTVVDHLLMPLLQLSARALGLEENTLVDAHKGFYATLKLSHYPGVKSAIATSSKQQPESRYGAHTDWEGFTLLLPDENDDWENGMEAMLPNGRWVSLGPPPSNSFIVNAGDFFPVWTRGRWLSPVHRVMMTDKTRDRFTIPLFTGPDLKSTVKPLVPNYLDDPRQFEPFVAGEWLEAKISRAKI